jgi:hypothetical protein
MYKKPMLMAAALPALLLLGLAGCTQKPPACDDAAVVSQLKKENEGDAVLKRLLESNQTISNIVDEGMQGNLRRCSATTSGTFILKDDLAKLDKELKNDSTLTIDERLAASTYVFSLDASGLKAKGDTYTSKGKIKYTTAYDNNGNPVVNVILAE